MSSHAKQRTCIVCRKTDTKQSFLRVVRTPEGQVELDPTGKKNGRGAYVCGIACFERAIATKRFDSALRTKLTEDDYGRLKSDVLKTL